jgi:hypothetical protein
LMFLISLQSYELAFKKDNITDIRRVLETLWGPLDPGIFIRSPNINPQIFSKGVVQRQRLQVASRSPPRPIWCHLSFWAIGGGVGEGD